jgi:hypothetical protein
VDAFLAAFERIVEHIMGRMGAASMTYAEYAASVAARGGPASRAT